MEEKDEPKYQFREKNPGKKQYFELFLTTGWNHEYNFTREELFRAISRSWYAVSVYHKNRLTGYGRVISDGGHHALIVDLMVSPEYQKRGIGSAILKNLIDTCNRQRIRDIQLFCARGKKNFYERFGFTERLPDAPGMEFKPAATPAEPARN